MKDIILSLITSEKEKTKRFQEFHDFFREIITTVPKKILDRTKSFKASKYMYAPWKEDFKTWSIEFNVDDFEWWYTHRDHVILKKNGLAKLKEDLKLRLEVIDLEYKTCLGDEE